MAPGNAIGQEGEWTQRNYLEHGFGLWVVQTHEGMFVGDCGLTMQEVAGEWLVEIGWHSRSDLQGRGYATEAALSVREREVDKNGGAALIFGAAL